MCNPNPTVDNSKALEVQQSLSPHTELAAFNKTPEPSLLKAQELVLMACFLP